MNSLTIYKASAGSGKTFALATEYIAQLLRPHAEHEFEHLLAVTFTNKATAEMKSRILETLYALQRGLPGAKPYMDAIAKKVEGNGHGAWSEKQIREQAAKVLSAILHDYSHLRVETIDSFFQSILRGMARELGLAANLQVELSHEELISSSVDSLIETMAEQPEVSRWVMDYVREQIDSGDKWDIVRPLKALASGIFREEYQRRSQEELNHIADSRTVQTFKRKMQVLRQTAEADVQQAADNLIAQINDSTLPFDKISLGRSLHKFLLEAREMKSDGPTATIIGQAEGSKPLPLAAYRKDSACLADAEVLQEALSAFLSLYADRRRTYTSASLALRNLAPLRLLVCIDERAREIEGEAGRFTLSSTPALLGKMVEGSDAPFIFEKIGTFVNYVMIDEFQDTSRMQWENFKKLLFEKLASGGKGLLVGDIKQSIYRWRSGDWKILYGIEHERELKHFSIQPKLLDTNYRSHQTIVDFNNAFFPSAACRLDAIRPDAPIKLHEVFADVCQKPSKADGKGYVRIVLHKEQRARGKEQEAGAEQHNGENQEDYQVRDMAEQIRALHADGLDFSQIAILVRTNGAACQLVEGFGHCAPDIPFVSDEAFLLEASVSLQMLIAALRMLVDFSHTDSISEKYLMFHYRRDVMAQKDTSLQDIAQLMPQDVLPEAFTAHRDELLQLPLYLLVERLWRILSLDRIEGEDAYMFTFLDELQNHLRSAAPDIRTFLTAWDEKLHKQSIPSSSVAGVRILTIHKSKGLEFHTVLLPFSQWQIENDRPGDVLWAEAETAPYNELGALPIPIQSRDVRCSVFAHAYETEHLERRIDALNTLYVAFTRAAANLYIWGKTKPAEKFDVPSRITTAADLIYMTLRSEQNDTDPACFFYEQGTPLTEVKAERRDAENRLCIRHGEQEALQVKVVAHSPMFRFIPSSQTQDYLHRLQEGTAGRLSQREMGKRMHDVLSRIDDVGQLEDIVVQARQDGIVGEGAEWDAVIACIEEGFRDPVIASWFTAGATVYNECSIASIDAATGQPRILRPDRVVMTADGITVVDYKFGRASQHYHDQVRAYMNLMHNMYPQHHVHGYLWYVLEGRTVPVSAK